LSGVYKKDQSQNWLSSDWTEFRGFGNFNIIDKYFKTETLKMTNIKSLIRCSTDQTIITGQTTFADVRHSMKISCCNQLIKQFNIMHQILLALPRKCLARPCKITYSRREIINHVPEQALRNNTISISLMNDTAIEKTKSERPHVTCSG